MRFDRNLYAEAWRVLCILWPYVLLAVLADFASEATLPLSTAYLGDSADLIHLFAVLLIWSLLLYKAYAEVLQPDGLERRVPPLRLLGFTVRLFGVYLPSELLFYAVVLILFGATTGTLGDLISVETTDPDILDIVDDPSFAANLLILLLAVMGMSLPFFLYGTVLPAYVANSGRGFGRALRRGRRQFAWFAGRLVLGPGVMALCTLALYKLPPLSFGPESDLTPAYDFSNPVLSVTTLIAIFTQAYTEIMLAVLLSRVFLRDEAASGEPVPGEESSAASVVS